MYEVGRFQPPSVYVGLRVLFDAEVFTIESVGPFDVRVLPAALAAGEFVWADETARVWGEERLRIALAAPAYAPAEGKRQNTVMWVAVAALVALAAFGVWSASQRPGQTTPGIGPNTGPIASDQGVVGNWIVTQGEDPGTTYQFTSDGRAYWSASSGTSWEIEWAIASDGTLTIRREEVTLVYAVQMSADGRTMQWTGTNREGTTLLSRQ